MKNDEILKNLINIQNSIEWVLNCKDKEFNITKITVLKHSLENIKFIAEEMSNRENKRLQNKYINSKVEELSGIMDHMKNLDKIL